MTDPDQELIDAARGLLRRVAGWGLDFLPEYAALLAAVDAKDRDYDERVWAWMGSSEQERP